MVTDLPVLLPNESARVRIQQTNLSYDVLGRYVCNTWEELQASIAGGAYPFDAIVIGAGMFGAYCAEKLYRIGASLGLRILVIDAGKMLFSTHVQNLPRRLGPLSGEPVWGRPWQSNDQSFPGLAYCLGGRSLLWGGWAPRLLPDNVQAWPQMVRNYLDIAGNTGAYFEVAEEIGVIPSTDYIVKSAMYQAVEAKFTAAKIPTNAALAQAGQGAPTIDTIEEAPLAVQGEPPQPGLFSFDKFSSAMFLVDAVRDDVAFNTSHDNVSRRLIILPAAQVLRLNTTGNTVTSIDLALAAQNRVENLTVGSHCVVILACGTIESTRLALESFPIGMQRPSGRRWVSNLMAHLRSNIAVRIRRQVFGLSQPPSDIELAALLVRGRANGRHFHIQVTGAPVFGNDSEANMWSMVPDIEHLDDLKQNQDPEWIVFMLRGIGEMEDHRVLQANPMEPDLGTSWIDLSPYDFDRWNKPKAYVHLMQTQTDGNVWDAMDEAIFKLAETIAGAGTNVQYWNKPNNTWVSTRPTGPKFWRDNLGTTHHETGPLFMGAQGTSVTDADGKFHDITNAYVVGPALFPTIGSANPSLTALALARRTAEIVVARARPAPDPRFASLSLEPKNWTMVAQPETQPRVRLHGDVLETIGGYGLYWYTKEQFANFELKLEWRIARRDDNSGIYIRLPDPTVANPLGQADTQGYEVQIDEAAQDNLQRTGAIYNLQGPSALAANGLGAWNTYHITANGSLIEVRLNGQLVNSYQGNRRNNGFIALQSYSPTSRVQFRSLQVRKLP